MSLWLRGFDAKGKTHRQRMAVGSFFIALTVECRPTMILTVVLAFPAFLQEIREGKFFSLGRESLLNTGAVILPFIPVGLLQMLLNSSRLGSPFDFGADYNLSVTDLTRKTYSSAKNIPFLFQELFQPPHIEAKFPFITGIEVTTDYQGYMFIDKMIGGFFALNLLALFCFWIFRLRKRMAANKVFGLASVSFGLAALLVELDVHDWGDLREVHALLRLAANAQRSAGDPYDSGDLGQTRVLCLSEGHTLADRPVRLRELPECFQRRSGYFRTG